jgi:predicted Zn finger-like uncharacterized protein
VKISCPTCAAKYSVADEKIQSRLAKIRCRKCSSTIVIDGTASPASVYIGEGSSPISQSAPPQEGAAEVAPISARTSGGALGVSFSDRASEPVGPAADEYAVDIADNDQRNMTIHQIVGAYNEGLISADTYIWKEGMADWQTLAEVRDVAEALHAAARPMGAPAAVRRPGPATDLFGSIDTAGGENDITTSAPQAVMTAGTGARNESSVLFSLSALTSTPEVAPSASAKRGRASNDDSGLIDLQALTSAEAAAGAGAYAAPVGAFGASPLISAPLGGVSSPAMSAALASGYGRRSNRSLVIAAFVLAAGIIGAAAVVVRRGGTDESEATSALDQEAALAPQRSAAAEQPAKVEEEPVAAADEGKEPIGKAKDPDEKDSVAADDLPAAADPAPVAKPSASARAPVARAPRSPARAKPQPAAAAPAPEPAPAAAPKPAAAAASESGDADKKKKPASRCVCAPSDLMCAMKCSAKR